MKQFQIEDITISLEEELVQELIKYVILEDEKTNSETCKEGNSLTFKNFILAGFSHSADDLEVVTLKWIREHYTNEEISREVRKVAIDTLEIYGGK